jgi:predicted ATPase
MHLLKLTLRTRDFPDPSRYPFSLKCLRKTRELVFERPVTLLVGDNGTGKSTLLRALAQAAGVHIWRFEGGARLEPNPYEEALADYMTVTWANGKVPGAFFSSDLFHDFSQLLEEWARADPGQLRYFGGRSLLTQSHGESLMTYFEHRYRLPGLYLLDEPETALSPERQLKLCQLLAERGRSGQAQFVVATHSPLVMAAAGAELLSFDGELITPIQYRDTEHYRAYSAFFRGQGGPVN